QPGKGRALFSEGEIHVGSYRTNVVVNFSPDTKKSWTVKRKASFGNQEDNSAKQRKTNTTDQHSGYKNKTENRQQPVSPISKSTLKPKTSQRKGPGEDKSHDRPLIKTSSLFRNNPEIPDVLSPAVTQVKEKVFTSNSFEELDLHPHLVATLHKVLNVSSMTSVQKETIPVLMSGKDA
ncbi:hypothetical protein NFI96_034145, partial [Prochilodus magdalenae]